MLLLPNIRYIDCKTNMNGWDCVQVDTGQGQ